MNYMNKTISEATALELLHAIMHTAGINSGPKKRTFNEPVSESIIAIGNDTSATITVFDADFPVFNKLVRETKVRPKATGGIKGRLHQIRTERGLTQSQVAEKSGLACGAISHYETGLREPSIRSLSKLAGAFNCTTDWLIRG